MHNVPAEHKTCDLIWISSNIHLTIANNNSDIKINAVKADERKKYESSKQKEQARERERERGRLMSTQHVVEWSVLWNKVCHLMPVFGFASYLLISRLHELPMFSSQQQQPRQQQQRHNQIHFACPIIIFTMKRNETEQRPVTRKRKRRTKI